MLFKLQIINYLPYTILLFRWILFQLEVSIGCLESCWPRAAYASSVQCSTVAQRPQSVVTYQSAALLGVLALQPPAACYAVVLCTKCRIIACYITNSF